MRKRPQSQTGKKAGIRSARKAKSRGPKTASEYFAKSQKFQDTWNSVAQVVSRMRADRVSLQQASREFGLAPSTVLRWGSSALRKRANGQYVSRTSDRLLRVLVIPTSKGLQEVAVTDSRNASDLGMYWDAVQGYLETGKASELRKFRRRVIKDANGVRIPLITDTEELDRLGSAGVLSFESLYAQAA